MTAEEGPDLGGWNSIDARRKQAAREYSSQSVVGNDPILKLAQVSLDDMVMASITCLAISVAALGGQISKLDNA